jgi:phenylpropionate dioxygenase-like ring-hydroxylating dioxygenase large terminal subunit
MLKPEQNALLTQTNPGTPCGELLRRYWQPVALARELTAAAPLPVKVMGQDLVLFRDDQHRIGLLGLHCAHRGADLSYGRLEDGGLRCLYHGWLYNVRGRCLEQPGEPAGSTFHERIRQPAYPCVEKAGLIFAYLGPGEPPLLPAYEPLAVPDDHRYVTKAFHDCNFLQGNEGEIDPVHLSYLHRRMDFRPESQRTIKGSEGTLPMTFYVGDRSPRIDAEETEYGVRIFSIRQAGDDRIYLRQTNFVLPNLSTVVGPMAGHGYNIHWHVPIDDTHHWKYEIVFRRAAPLDETDWQRFRAGETELTEDYHLVRNRANRYLQDRASMSWNFCGLGTNNTPQDACAVEGAGPIQDRTQEHLGTTDKAIIAARQRILDAIQAVQEGGDPPHVLRDPTANRLAHITVLSEIVPATEDYRCYWEKVVYTASGAGT